jgi:hypothetical protein
MPFPGDEPPPPPVNEIEVTIKANGKTYSGKLPEVV